MASKRSNPKKNKAARRPRPSGTYPPDLRRAGLGVDDVGRLISGMPPPAIPLVALTSVWLWNLAQDRHAAAHCVEGCLTLQYALAEYGIASRPEAIAIRIQGNGSDALYGEHPRYNADGTFNGHTILVAPGAGRFADPTIQQFPELPRTRRAALPMQAQLPRPDGMGDLPVTIDRLDHMVTYQPLAAGLRQSWRNERIAARDADFHKAGTALASNVIAMFQLDGLRERAARAPYPRLRTILQALEGTEAVADSSGWYFVDRHTGAHRRLADIP